MLKASTRKRFVHSVKVPRIYKIASLIAKKVVEEGGSLKDLVYNCRHKNIKGIYALVVETIKHSEELNNLIKNSKLLEKEVFFQPWLARILITELFYGKKELKGESKPVQTILSYKNELEKLLLNEPKALKCIDVAVKKPRYVRVNTLHYTPDEVIKIFRKEGWYFLPECSNYPDFLKTISTLEKNVFTRDFHIKELLVFPASAKFYENELYKNGSILLQDKASCLPAFLLKPKPNSVVLDMCSAPGMKTTHLSALMKNKGRIYATEKDPRRFKVLCNIIKTCGCSNVIPIHADILNVNQNKKKKDFSWVENVEYILVDPSCSGSGIVERMNIFKEEEKNNSERLKKLCKFQFKLLQHALTNFPKVKRVVYSTCSVHPEENEMVVEDVLKKLNTLETNEKIKVKLAEPLKNTWFRRGSDEFEYGRQCIFSDPEKDLTNGFFVAVFERLEENSDILEKSEEFKDSSISKCKENKHKRKSEFVDTLNEKKKKKFSEDENEIAGSGIS